MWPENRQFIKDFLTHQHHLLVDHFCIQPHLKKRNICRCWNRYIDNSFSCFHNPHRSPNYRNNPSSYDAKERCESNYLLNFKNFILKNYRFFDNYYKFDDPSKNVAPICLSNVSTAFKQHANDQQTQTNRAYNNRDEHQVDLRTVKI